MGRLADWIDARDGESLARAWTALAAKRVEVCPADCYISNFGAAQLAASFLGWPIERLAWIYEGTRMPPTFEIERQTARCYVETGLDRPNTWERWEICEIVEGDRGIQHVYIYWRESDGTREGNGDYGTLVRVFDRAADRGIAIFVGKQHVAVFGEHVDVSALELVEHVGGSFRTRTRPTIEKLRGIVAILASELDAHFDVNTEWTGGMIKTYTTPPTDPGAPNTRYDDWRFESDGRAVEITETIYADGTFHFSVHLTGLPWGMRLSLSIATHQGRFHGSVGMCASPAQIRAVRGRLAKL